MIDLITHKSLDAIQRARRSVATCCARSRGVQEQIFAVFASLTSAYRPDRKGGGCFAPTMGRRMGTWGKYDQSELTASSMPAAASWRPITYMCK